MSHTQEGENVRKTNLEYKQTLQGGPEMILNFNKRLFDMKSTSIYWLQNALQRKKREDLKFVDALASLDFKLSSE